ncbi:transketolase [Candidatus Peregrinibacteria bacterium]|nr:transketolase [Candidatus Peregrinibacteria bacterium]
MNIPQIGESLTQEHLEFLKAFAKSCRWSAIAMLKNSQSGHPGGSLSSMEWLTLIYTFIVSQTGEDVVISNGHISPAVYSVLAELKYIPKHQVIEKFRKPGDVYEGHVTREVSGIRYGTGPLGIGASVACGFALAEKLKEKKNNGVQKNARKVFLEIGDGEAQEGQIYEMIHFARKYSLDNLITFVDCNEVQLSDSIEKIMPVDIVKTFEAAHWEVMEADGHDFQALWKCLEKAYGRKGKPIVIIGNTIMGKGVDFMEAEGRMYKATWHGNAPKPEQADLALSQLELTEEEKKRVENFLLLVQWHPEKQQLNNGTIFIDETGFIDEEKVNPENTFAMNAKDEKRFDPIVYGAETLTDCRTAYGKALLDLAKRNPRILALTADLKASVMTKFVDDEFPNQHIECGIAEQHMISMAGGLSLSGFIPFASTFGAFMTSRAKDQARVNDINKTNVKMVATHCGLSVGEDGPTHQAIDDMGSFLGFFNTMIIEPADPNQTDRIIRYIASHYGNFYVRMGRHKFPVITKEDGSIFYDRDYVYEYGKTDNIREGKDLTLVASGAMVLESVRAREVFIKKHPEFSIEVIAASSIKKFDDTLLNSVKKTRKVITIEDHNTYSGLGSQLARTLAEEGIKVEKFQIIGVREYQLSGKVEELYEKAGIALKNIVNAVELMLV